MEAVTTAVLLATQEGGASGAELVLPATAELIWGLIGFALLLAFVIWKIWPTLNTMLEERRAKIQGQLEEAEQIRVEAEELRRQYQAQLRDARSKADAIIDEARGDAERVREQKVAEAEQEAQAIRERARADAEAERARLVQQLRTQVATLSVDLAGRIVHRELDEEQHRTLVDEYIDQLASMN
jgi:F-type H+-transporting ATPase subunit b